MGTMTESILTYPKGPAIVPKRPTKKKTLYKLYPKGPVNCTQRAQFTVPKRPTYCTQMALFPNGFVPKRPTSLYIREMITIFSGRVIFPVKV